MFVVAKTIAFLVSIINYFWFATFGKDVPLPIWKRRAGKSVIHIYNNHHAARKAAENPKDSGYQRATLGRRGNWSPRLQKVHFRNLINY